MGEKGASGKRSQMARLEQMVPKDKKVRLDLQAAVAFKVRGIQGVPGDAGPPGADGKASRVNRETMVPKGEALKINFVATADNLDGNGIKADAFPTARNVTWHWSMP